MILTCNRIGLLAACQTVSQAIATRTPKPILSNIKAVASVDHGLVLTATDLEIGMRHQMTSINLEEPGSAILPATKLIQILRESPDDELKLDADDRRCKVTMAAAEYEMPSEDPSGFPDVPEFEDSNCSEIAAGVLKTMIHRTNFATAKQDSKYVITGVLWEVEDGKIKLVATDTRRLAVCVGMALSTNKPTNAMTLVPHRAMGILKRLLIDGNVSVCLRNNDAMFRFGNTTISSRLLEGRYPPYKDIIPKKASIKVPLQVGSFLQAVRQAQIMIEQDTSKVGFGFAPGKLTLTANGATTGKSKVEMPLDYDGKALGINFDPEFVLEMLKVLDKAEIIQLDMTDASKPALFRIGDDYLYLVMPLS